MISKPIDLIVANTMHDAVGAMAQVKQLTSALDRIGLKGTLDFNLSTEVARKLLCSIAHDADIAKVYAALLAVGAPCTADDIQEGLRAVEERAR